MRERDSRRNDRHRMPRAGRKKERDKVGVTHVKKIAPAVIRCEPL